jgi:hypothetical protein
MSTFRGVIDFFADLGMYDVVLPFLLVFAMVFAILEKSRVFGTEPASGGEPSGMPKKNINAIVAFCVAFFVVASAQLVEVIIKVSSHMVIFLLALVLFMVLIGSFMAESKTGVALTGPAAVAFAVMCFIAIVLIFLNGLNWLDPLYQFIVGNFTNEIVATVIMMAIILGAIALIIGGGATPNPAKKE